MNAYKLLTAIVVSVLVAILLASALNSFTRVTDSALADNSLLLQGGGRAGDGGSNAPRTSPGKNYLPIIFLNSATAGAAWLLAGNAGTNYATDFLGTTDKVTFTIRVSNTIAFRILPAYDPFTPGFAPNIIGGYGGNTVAPDAYGATIAGGGVNGYPNVITASGSYATIGGGVSNNASNYDAAVGGGFQNIASGYASTVGGGGANSAIGGYTTIGGGIQNTASSDTATVGGGDSNIASSYAATVGGGVSNNASNFYTTVGGGYGNTASGAGAFVGGGGWNGSSTWGNKAQAPASTISGGWRNVISSTASYAFIGGGRNNTASGYAATVSGGTSNTASLDFATVSGGVQNFASGSDATVGGGSNNTASGGSATVPGGFNNIASGNSSFAAGYNANTNNKSGAFVWADSTGAVLSAALANQFLVRASGGITLYTNSAATSGASLYPGSGSWNILSNKNLKANFANVDSRAILAQVSALPITTWNYTTQDASIRHIGPMAQDFYSAFNVGENDTTISTVDAQGVALAAIQGLYQVVQDRDAQIAAQQNDIVQLKQDNVDIKTRLYALEQGTGTANAFPISRDAMFVGTLVVVVGVVIARRQRRA